MEESVEKKVYLPASQAMGFYCTLSVLQIRSNDALSCTIPKGLAVSHKYKS